MKVKRKLLYNGTPLTEYKRTEIFTTALELLFHLLKSDKYSISVYCQQGKEHLVDRVLKENEISDINIIFGEDLNDYEPEIFFSACDKIPQFIEQNPNIIKYGIIYHAATLAITGLDEPQPQINDKTNYFAISEYTKNDFVRFFPQIDPQRITVVYPGASEQLYCCDNPDVIAHAKEKYGIPSDKLYMVLPYSSLTRKNSMHVMRRFAEFINSNRIDDVYLGLVGGDRKNFLLYLQQEMVDIECLEDHVIHLGDVEREDMAPLYSGALCTIYLPTYEGFALPVLEAMQCGCPVITGNVTSMPEFAGDAGILIDPLDPVELENTFLRVYSDAELRRRCRQLGLVRSDLFSWEKCVALIIDTIERTTNVAANAVTPLTRNEKRSVFRKLFGKVYRDSGTKLYIFGLPVLEKRVAAYFAQIRFIGIPIATRRRGYFTIETFVFGIKIISRVDFERIAGLARLFTDIAASAIPGQKKEKKRYLFSKLINDIATGQRTVQHEAREISMLVQRNTADEERL